MPFSLKIWLATLLSCVSVLSCVDTYYVKIEAGKGYVVVDGTLTTLNEPQAVRLFLAEEGTIYESSEFSGTISPPQGGFQPLSGLDVRVLKDSAQFFLTQEIEPGLYQMPDGFQAEVGAAYQLLFQYEGSQFVSSQEVVVEVPLINRVRAQYNPELQKSLYTPNVNLPTYDFFVDFQDPKEDQNFYLWRWVDYELQNFCATCQQSRYVLSDTLVGVRGQCVEDPFLNPFFFFDYECNGFCWDSFESEAIEIFSDLNTNGLPQIGKKVASIPVFQSNACLVSIRQLSLTPGAFRYYKLAAEQAFNSGSLADTPPAPNRSNVTNINKPEELIQGYFTVSAVSESRFMLRRDEAVDAKEFGLFEVINNRPPNLETQDFGRVRIPLATCVEGFNRTSNAPLNWQFGF